MNNPPIDGYLKAKLTVGYTRGTSARYAYVGYVQTLGTGSLTPYGGNKKSLAIEYNEMLDWKYITTTYPFWWNGSKWDTTSNVNDSMWDEWKGLVGKTIDVWLDPQWGA